MNKGRSALLRAYLMKYSREPLKKHYTAIQWCYITKIREEFEMLKYEITQTRQEKKAGRWVTVSGSTKTVDAEWVKRFMDAIPFFKSMGGKEATQGSKASPKKHTSTSPCGTLRTITEFKEVEGC